MAQSRGKERLRIDNTPSGWGELVADDLDMAGVRHVDEEDIARSRAMLFDIAVADRVKSMTLPPPQKDEFHPQGSRIPSSAVRKIGFITYDAMVRFPVLISALSTMPGRTLKPRRMSSCGGVSSRTRA
jgi:hypothetical protein